MVLPMGIVVFDLEGVLIDNTERYQRAVRKANPSAKNDKDLNRNEKKAFWQEFFNPQLAEKIDKVNLEALKLVDKYQKEGKKIVILSGSKKDVVRVMLKKIEEEAKKLNMEFKPAMVIWRSEKDYRKSDVFKLEKAKIVEKMLGDEIIEVHDDDENVIKIFEKNGIKAVLWRNLKPIKK